MRDQGLGDLALFGSQALSVYSATPLKSKDLDLVSSQIGPAQLAGLNNHLSKQEFQVRSTTVQSKPLARGEMRTYSIELRLADKPFIVEIFDRILDGQQVSALAPYLDEKKRWGIDLWVPNPNAVVALRLCFRRPEGISRFNATRLNRFIEQQKNRISIKEVGTIIEQWKLLPLASENLYDLYKRHRIKITKANKDIRQLLLQKNTPGRLKHWKEEEHRADKALADLTSTR